MCRSYGRVPSDWATNCPTPPHGGGWRNRTPVVHHQRPRFRVWLPAIQWHPPWRTASESGRVLRVCSPHARRLLAILKTWHPGTDSNREPPLWRRLTSPSVTGAHLGRPRGRRASDSNACVFYGERLFSKQAGRPTTHALQDRLPESI